MWMTLIFYATTAFFVAATLAVLWNSRWMQRLPTLTEFSHGDGTSLPRPNIGCSIVVAARNEEARIEQTIRRLLAQQEVEGEFIVVDDRSTDRTGEILQQLVKEDLRIRVIRIETLPAGWLGKCHACHVGASVATREWILFTDADCWLKPDMIVRAVQLAERDGVDHVTLTSGLASKSPALQASHLAFLLSFANWFSGVNRALPKSYMGIGAFNLVRRSAYRECGGYEALRLTVLDDMKLGLLLRRAGKFTRAFLAGDDVECHWGTSVVNMIKIMEKNYFATLEFRLWLALALAAFVAFLICGVLLGIVFHTASGLAAAISPLLLIVPGAVLARRIGWSWRAAIGVPFVLPIFILALLNSTFVTLRQGGIRWRETFYSLEALRAGGVK
jgi:cellulose synthase/poly-beta-1,6-N-acetylglucosamine synthase-like glycosyltransferase